MSPGDMAQEEYIWKRYDKVLSHPLEQKFYMPRQNSHILFYKKSSMFHLHNKISRWRLQALFSLLQWDPVLFTRTRISKYSTFVLLYYITPMKVKHTWLASNMKWEAQNTRSMF